MSNEEGKAPRAKKGGVPRWLKITGIVVAVLIVLSAVNQLLGGGDDDESEAAAEETEDVSEEPATEDEDAESDTDDEAVEDEEAPAEPVEYEISEFDGDVFVEFEIREHFTVNLIASQAERDAAAGIQEAIEEFPEFDRMVLQAYREGADSPALTPFWEADTLAGIDLDDHAHLDLFEQRDGGMVHPDFED